MFGEQAVLCGGVVELMKAGFDTLCEAGYAPEMAYFECIHEMKLIVDLIYEGGIANMNYSVSNTAEYGEYVSGPRVITQETRAEMKRILADITSGRFTRDWMLENKVNQTSFKATRAKLAEHPAEQIGAKLREMMPWIRERALVDKSQELILRATRRKPYSGRPDRGGRFCFRRRAGQSGRMHRRQHAGNGRLPDGATRALGQATDHRLSAGDEGCRDPKRKKKSCARPSGLDPIPRCELRSITPLGEGTIARIDAGVMHARHDARPAPRNCRAAAPG